jgi:hypothetical protein
MHTHSSVSGSQSRTCHSGQIYAPGTPTLQSLQVVDLEAAREEKPRSIVLGTNTNPAYGQIQRPVFARPRASSHNRH